MLVHDRWSIIICRRGLKPSTSRRQRDFLNFDGLFHETADLHPDDLDIGVEEVSCMRLFEVSMAWSQSQALLADKARML